MLQILFLGEIGHFNLFLNSYIATGGSQGANDLQGSERTRGSAMRAPVIDMLGQHQMSDAI